MTDFDEGYFETIDRKSIDWFAIEAAVVEAAK